MITNRQLSEEQTEIRRHFIDFLDSDGYGVKYSNRLHTMMTEGKSRIILDIGDLLEYSGGLPQGGIGSLGHGILKTPSEYIPICELAVHEVVLRRQPDYLKVDYRSRPVHVGFEGPVGKVHGPRELYARHLNQLVALEGIITKQSPLRPRIVESVHYCPATNKYSRKEYRDLLSPMVDSQHLPTVNVMPRSDMQGNPLRTELGLCTFMDSQCAVMQEAPEAAPTGQLPRSIELRFDDDLVDSVKPGDRVQVVGTYAPYTAGDNKGGFQTIVLVNNVVRYQAAARIPRLVESHITKIKKFAADCVAKSPSTLVDILASSIAPAVFGLKNEKKAVLLMLLGGVERRANNSHIRGDINVLLVGEPSVAKSQLLRYVLSLAPLALNTTGKGSSGVGLTAAVTVDSYTGERSLSAGAMVLADRGILCIDEFDKMSPQDRVSMHEAMEQQTVTIAKAGIHASLNARCSVLAAANPVYGFYSVKHKLSFNVGLPESLLSRFDLTFIILDQHSSEHNRRIGSHILRNHMNSKPVPFEVDTSKTVIERDGGAHAEAQQAGGHSADNGAVSMTENNSGELIVPVDFLRQYIEYAKSFSPMLTPSSQQLISQHYVQLREEQQADGNATKDGFFVTPRTLEALVRLSTAHAKLRLSTTVEEEDVTAAMTLLRASVHAAGEALESRQKDQEIAGHEDGASPPGAGAPGAPGSGPSPSYQRGAADLGDSDERPSKYQRLEGTGGSTNITAPTPSQEHSANTGKIIIDALTLFRREHRTEVHLHELREKLTQTGLANLDLPSLQEAVSQMDNDTFSFSSTPTEDVIYLA